MTESVLALMKIVLPVLVTIILSKLIQVWGKLKENEPLLARMLYQCAEIGYHAAEEYFRDDEDHTGSDKMNYAVSIAKDYLAEVFHKQVSDAVMEDEINKLGCENEWFSWTREPEPEPEAELPVPVADVPTSAEGTAEGVAKG